MDNRLQVEAIYTDYAKAFDRVDHNILLKKLAFNGIRGNLLRWFSSYVLNRSQRVIINGFSSNIINVSSGVPQGSILGPLLFILFVNDIGDCFRFTNFLLYADDLKIYRSVNTIEDCDKIQQDLNRLANYCEKNKLHLSTSKCKHITFTKKINIIKYTYKLNCASLESVSLIRDLGLYLDSKLHFDEHVTHITNKAFQLYGFVMRTCSSFQHPTTFLTLYKTLIRSQVEYASVIWSPMYNKYSLQLERVQRKFLKSTMFKCFKSNSNECYELLLRKFSILSLESRRILLDQTLLYNICHNKFDCNELTNQIYIRIPSRSKRIRELHSHQIFFPKQSKTNAGARAPLNRIMEQYNKKFNEIDIFGLTSSKFKKAVYEVLSVSDAI